MKIRRLGFTLFEILIAVALLVVLSVVLLRVFVLIADFWTAGDEQARLYADAKTALSILSEDLENVVYDTASVEVADGNTAPMFLEANTYTTSVNLPAFNTISRYESGQYGPTLDFVTRTSWKMDNRNHDGASHEVRSELCKVSYVFSPPTTGGPRNMWSNSFSADGELKRICRGDYQSSEVAADNCSMRIDWSGHQEMINYFPFNVTGTDGRIITRFGQTVVTGVLDFRVYAYREGQTRPVALMISNSNRISQKDSDGHEIDDRTTDSQTMVEGMKGINRIRIVLTLMPPARLAELRNITGTTDQQKKKQKEYIQKYARTFHKTIRIKEMAQ